MILKNAKKLHKIYQNCEDSHFTILFYYIT